MSKESYARGFCKAAEEHGVDPVELAKYAQIGINRYGPTVDNARLYDTFRSLGLKANSPYSTPSEPNKPSLLSKPKQAPGSRPIDVLRRAARTAPGLSTGFLNSIVPGLGTGMNHLSSGIARRIKSLLPR